MTIRLLSLYALLLASVGTAMSMGYSDDDIAKIQSQEGQDFKIEVKAIKHSETIKNLIEEAGIENPIPLPNITTKELKKIIGMLKGLTEAGLQHGQTTFTKKQQKIVTHKLNPLSAQDVAELLQAINYLDIKLLLMPVLMDLAIKINDSNALASKELQAILPRELRKLLVKQISKINGVYSAMLAESKEPTILTGHTSCVYSVVFSPDGKQLASGSLDSTIRLWDVETGKELKKLTGHRAPVFSVAFSPDGKQLASRSQDSTIRLWNVETGKEVKKLTGHRAPVISVAFSPDGKQLGSGYVDYTIRLWDVETGQLNTLTGHKSDVYSVAFSPDGTQLASGSWDKTIRLWNITTGRLLNKLTGHTKSVDSVAFSPDGRQLASGSWDTTIRLWAIGINQKWQKVLDNMTIQEIQILGWRLQGIVFIGDAAKIYNKLVTKFPIINELPMPKVATEIIEVIKEKDPFGSWVAVTEED